MKKRRYRDDFFLEFHRDGGELKSKTRFFDNFLKLKMRGTLRKRPNSDAFALDSTPSFLSSNNHVVLFAR